MDHRFFVIDAMAFAFRAFYAIRSGLSDGAGRPTNAVYGFTRILIKLLREQNPAHIAVVFDAPGKTFREDLYPEYKANRAATPDELKEQFPRMHEVVEALALPLFCVPGVEADDVIGTLARQAQRDGLETVLVSGDKDLMQLIGPGVCMFDPGKGENGIWSREAEVVERFGVGPDRVPDALALIGDTADNVPGVHGIGEKTAKKLMEAYGSLENLYENIGALKGKQRENLEADRAQAFFSRTLLAIKTDVPLDRGPLECHRRAPDRDRAMDVLGKLGFASLVEETLTMGTAPEMHAEEPRGYEAERLDYRLLLTEAEIERAIAEMRAAGEFAVDTETTSVDPMRAELVGVSLSCAPDTGYYIPIAHTPEALTFFRDPDDLTTVEQLEPAPRARALELLRPLLEDASIGKIGHNIKYDLLVLRRAGIALAGIALDTMVASYLTDPSRLRHNLDEVSLHYLRRTPIPISDLIGKGAKAITFDCVPVDRAARYAAEDADLAFRLAAVFRPKLREQELETLYTGIEAPLIEVLAGMEETGIALDVAVFDRLRVEIAEKLAALEKDIFEAAGEQFNVNSPKQLQGILFDKLGLKPVRKTKTGFSTDVDALEDLKGQHALPELILEFRTLEKLRGTYVDALPQMLNPRTKRVHTSFNQAVAATGRLSSSDPNLQNIPVRTDYGRRIREGFVPGRPDWRLISADYSQIELRILAHLSGDANLQAAFRGDADIHRDTAARVFGARFEDVTSEMRRQAKAVNFGVVYGISAFGLARNLGISNHEAASFIEAYFAQYPGVRAWLDETIALAHRQGYVTTMLNRRRYVPDLASENQATRKGAERMAINTPVQGTAADLIKLAMVHVDAPLRKLGARLLLQVHDELVAEAPEDRAEEAAALLRETMEQAMTLDVPLKVDVGIGRNWAEIH